MSGTTIQIKKSTVTAIPTSLNVAEPAYSYVGNILWLGNESGNGVIAIGGKFFVDQQNVIFEVANAAFAAANSAGSQEGMAQIYDQANTARTHANSAFAVANSGLSQATIARTHANSAFGVANSALSIGSLAFNQANTARTHANSAYNQANVATTIGSSAFDAANTKFSSSGGTIAGDVSIVGDLTVAGNTVFVNSTTLNVSDPMIFLAANNRVSDVVDIGFIGNYVNATGINVATGLFRDSGTKEYYIFQGYDKDISVSNHIDPEANGFTIALLNADLRTSNIILGGVNAISWIRAAYNHANSGFIQANTGVGIGQAAFLQANTARTHANSAFLAANSSYTVANVAPIAFNVANAAYGMANTANVNASNATFLTIGTVPSGRLSGTYSGITGVGTITSGIWNGSIITVPYGGTGLSTANVNGVLYGNGVSSIKVTAAGVEGQVLQVMAGGTPAFAHIDAGTF